MIVAHWSHSYAFMEILKESYPWDEILEYFWHDKLRSSNYNKDIKSDEDKLKFLKPFCEYILISIQILKGGKKVWGWFIVFRHILYYLNKWYWSSHVLFYNDEVFEECKRSKGLCFDWLWKFHSCSHSKKKISQSRT